MLQKSKVWAKKALGLAIAGVMLVGCLTGCSAKTELEYLSPVKTTDRYDQDLFYRNDKLLQIADPQVLKVTDEESAEYGYYYLYATTGSGAFDAFRSKDLQNWESTSDFMGTQAFVPEKNAFGITGLWAPEVIYDEVTDKYYMYYTAQNRLLDKILSIGVAVADEPCGPFQAYKDATHDETTPLFDHNKLSPSGLSFSVLDANPFIAPDGTLYITFVRNNNPENAGQSDIYGVKMIDYVTPDYSTLTQLTKADYATVDGNETMLYEANSPINEAPYMYIHEKEDGTYQYLLTFSVNGATDRMYSVVQAVGDNPLGPFRKLTEEEGGVMLSIDNFRFDNVSGTGHHSFVEIGEELFIAYHEHVDPKGGSFTRAFAFDRVKEVKNKDGLTVLYANGPSKSVMPQIEAVSSYKNIAPEAKVSASSGENVEALTDDLVSIYLNVSHVKEFETKKDTTITMQFDDYKEITAVMVYNSKWYEKAFSSVKKIEFEYVDENNEKKTAVINDLKFDWDEFKNANVEDMRPAGSAVAHFSPIKVKEVRFYFENEKEATAISEIVILGAK